jgi:hypothetical protein
VLRRADTNSGALTVTPADITWYLSLFPDGENRIESLKTDGKIVVIEKVCENASINAKN